MGNKVKWVKFDKDNAQKQLREYRGSLLYLAFDNGTLDTDIWGGEEFEEYSMECIKYFTPFEFPDYPDGGDN